jgi:hypothetical protein
MALTSLDAINRLEHVRLQGAQARRACSQLVVEVERGRG